MNPMKKIKVSRGAFYCLIGRYSLFCKIGAHFTFGDPKLLDMANNQNNSLVIL